MINVISQAPCLNDPFGDIRNLIIFWHGYSFLGVSAKIALEGPTLFQFIFQRHSNLRQRIGAYRSNCPLIYLLFIIAVLAPKPSLVALTGHQSLQTHKDIIEAMIKNVQ